MSIPRSPSSSSTLSLGRFSFGMGDRFAHQARAQLRACVLASEAGLDVVPVWNKSNREHTIVGSKPPSVLAAAQEAVRVLGWHKPFHIDADHINLQTVDAFLDSSDFFTIDVAAAIGKPAERSSVDAFVARHGELLSKIDLPGRASLNITRATVEKTANKYLFACEEAARIYKRIENGKGQGRFITEVSMDETDEPQTPAELLIILAALADLHVPLQTIAPKFTGRFNKGVDYVGDVVGFEREFADDVAVIAHATKAYPLPATLKLSVHSGSDKFSIYPAMRRVLRSTGAGIHIKTAGTTWLEELIGLAEAGGEGLSLAKEIYAQAYDHRDDLCAPYAAVIDINPAKLPSPTTVNGWRSQDYVGALRHDQSCAQFNPSLRQLLHVGYKIAAHMGDRYLNMLQTCEESIARNVTGNLYDRHLQPLFLAGQKQRESTSEQHAVKV